MSRVYLASYTSMVGSNLVLSLILTIHIWTLLKSTDFYSVFHYIFHTIHRLKITSVKKCEKILRKKLQSLLSELSFWKTKTFPISHHNDETIVSFQPQNLSVSFLLQLIYVKREMNTLNGKVGLHYNRIRFIHLQ